MRATERRARTRTTVEVVEDPETLDALAHRWDALAGATDRPACSSRWMLAAARASRLAALRTAVVRDGDELIGVVPFAVERRGPLSCLRLLGADVTTGAEPLALPGREREVAEQACAALAARRADLLMLDGIPDGSPWPRLIAQAWPRGNAERLWRRDRHAATSIELNGADYETWLGTKGAKARHQLRRAERRLSARGVEALRTTDPERLTADLDGFVDLHRRHWRARGGSPVLDDEVERMLRDAAPALLAADQLDLWTLVADGRPVFASVGLRAGEEAMLWLNGADPAWRREPLTLGCLAAIVRDASERGVRRIALGPGEQEYKRRVADCADGASWWWLPLPGPRAALAVAYVAAHRARRRAARGLPGRQRERLQRLFGACAVVGDRLAGTSFL